MRHLNQGDKRRWQWPTLGCLAACYGVWALGLWAAGHALPVAVILVALAVALQASLQHEVIHGHPFRDQRLNAALVWPALGLLIPYARFRDTHLAHHANPNLTDPYDDPESNYLDPAVWTRLPAVLRALLWVNNTLLGRVLIGVAVSQVMFVAHELRLARQGDARVRRGWWAHLPAVGAVLGVVWLSPMPLWAYGLAAYVGLSLIKIRTFLEHQAHARAASRTVIIEDRGPLSFLFLNNNLHAVHHAKPELPWYALPTAYAREAARWQAMNGGYVYRGYGAILRAHLLRPKDPVPHPHWSSQNRIRSGHRSSAMR
jgi:fatty acid desaturase